MKKVIRQMLHAVVMWWRGIAWTDGKTTVYKNGWVMMTDGTSSDAIPLSFCSSEFIEKIRGEVSPSIWEKLAREIVANGLY